MASKDWLNFFQAAKIPSAASKQYAKAFTENRITTDMLMDLNKEYLRDMGIIILGDIIAILKHAKQVQSQLTNPDLQSQKPEPKSSPTTAPAAPTRKVLMAPSKEEPGSKPSAVVKRLGPPKTIQFAKPEEDNTRIFGRLGDKEQGALARIGPKVEARGSIRGQDDERIIINRRLPEPRSASYDGDTEKPKSRKYVLITKKSDGSEIREILEPGDPRIASIGVTHKRVVKHTDSRTLLSTADGLKRSVSSSHVATKRSRITAPSSSSRMAGPSNDNAMREPRSISSRLGPKPTSSNGPIVRNHFSPEQSRASSSSYRRSEDHRTPFDRTKPARKRIEYSPEQQGHRVTDRLGYKTGRSSF